VTAAAGPGTARPGVRRRWRTVRERRPEWWLWGVGAAGLLVLVRLFVAGLGPPSSGMDVGHGGHDHGSMGGGMDAAALVPHAVAGIAMVAVMVPLVAPNVRYAALRSPRRARGSVVRAVVAGYVLTWALVAALLGVGVWLLTDAIGDLASIGLVTLVAVGWQYTFRKRVGLARCDALLAPPIHRRRARRVCRRYGVSLGRNCVQSCWPLMLLMAVAAHNPLVVVATTGVAWYERRRRPHHDPGTRATSLVVLATGAVAVTTTALLAY
jgi:predicted metal-binding membrane protein